MQPFAIPLSLYDGRLHRVPFERGPDFIAKWDALRADGFTVQAGAEAILACKIMPGDPIPPLAT